MPDQLLSAARAVAAVTVGWEPNPDIKAALATLRQVVGRATAQDDARLIADKLGAELVSFDYDNGQIVLKLEGVTCTYDTKTPFFLALARVLMGG